VASRRTGSSGSPSEAAAISARRVAFVMASSSAQNSGMTPISAPKTIITAAIPRDQGRVKR
jgi:hypothetical protein